MNFTLPDGEVEQLLERIAARLYLRLRHICRAVRIHDDVDDRLLQR